MKQKKYFPIFTLFLLFFVLLTAKTKVEASTTYNVTAEEFGAVSGDGNSDYKAIQKALNKARGTVAGVTVYIPAGTYHINKCLHIYSNTYLKLDRNATIVRMDSALTTNMLHAVDYNNQMDEIGGYAMCKNITVDGGIWDGGNSYNASRGSDLIRFDHGMNIVLKNADIRNVYNCHHVELVAIKNGQVLNCKFSGFYYDRKHKYETAYGREAIQIETAWTDKPKNLKNTKAYWAGGTKIDGTACRNIKIDGCTFTNLPSAIGQHHYSKSKKTSNTKYVTITNNKIIAASKYKFFKIAISCTGMSNVKISHNTIQGPYKYGVNVTHGKSISVLSNSINNIRKTGISISSAKVQKVTHNKITKAKKVGIYLSSARAYMIRKNRISRSKVGIYLRNKRKVTKKLKNKITKCKKKVKKR